jgi:hypothetical protein
VYENDTPEDLSAINVGHRFDNILDAPIHHLEIQQVLDQKRNLRAPGPDGFRVDFLRYVRFDEVVCKALANFFNLILNTSEIPESWGSAFLFVLYKGKGDRANPDSYRGITLKSQFLKLLESVVCNRLVQSFEDQGLLPLEQLAYRRGLSGTDHLFLLNVLKDDAILTGKQLCVGLIDLRKAFPSVNRRKLIEDLVSAGVTTRTVGLIRRLYVGDTFRLLLDGQPGHLVFCVVRGVHEGSCLSPTLFIFFIRELPSILNSLTLNTPVIGGLRVSCMFFADDLSVLAYEVPDAQILVNESVVYFESKGLTPNPEKCEFLVFTSRRGGSRRRWDVLGVQREEQDKARYLGLHYQSSGRWDAQLQLSSSKARSALGRCKIIIQTIGKGSVPLALAFFESIVASVYRFGLGVWGVTVAKVTILDRIFAEYISWLFRFPRTTGTNIILSNFGRRCAKCDSLFLASVQIASACSTRNSTWADTVRDLEDGVLQSTWFNATKSEIQKRGMANEVFREGANFVAARKLHGVHFSQFCFAHHLNLPTGSNSDLFRRSRPFGMYPFLLCTSTYESRFLFSFICSVWRFIDQKACDRWPVYCSCCDRENSGYHVLFECVLFSSERRRFSQRTGGIVFSFSALESDVKCVCRELVRTGKEIFMRIRYSA